MQSSTVKPCTPEDGGHDNSPWVSSRRDLGSFQEHRVYDDFQANLHPCRHSLPGSLLAPTSSPLPWEGEEEVTLQVFPGMHWARSTGRKRKREIESPLRSKKGNSKFSLERTSKFPWRKRAQLMRSEGGREEPSTLSGPLSVGEVKATGKHLAQE